MLSENSDELVKESFKKLKKDIEKHPETFRHESTIVARLYYFFCKVFDERKNSSEFQHIRLECNYSEYGNNIIGDKEERNQKMWKCVMENYPSEIPPKMKKAGKAGNYDLAILDSKNEKLTHVIEIKVLKDEGFNDGDRHRAYEDLYVLSDDLLGVEYHSSIFVILKHSKNRSKSEIDKLFKNMEETYKNAGVVNFESCAFVMEN